MATYFITTQQLGKLVTSHSFHKKRFYLSTTHIDKPAFEKIFSAKDTLAYSSQFEIMEGDVLLFTDHVAQCKAMAEIEVSRNGSQIGSTIPDSQVPTKE